MTKTIEQQVEELMNDLPNHHEDYDGFVCSSYYPENGGNYMAKGEKKECNCEMKYHREQVLKALQERDRIAREDTKTALYQSIENYVMEAELLDGSGAVTTSDILNKLKALTTPLEDKE